MNVPSFVKMYTDSGAAVNLKKSVWSKMIAATTRQAQLKTRSEAVIGRLMVEMTWVLMDSAPPICLFAVFVGEAGPVLVRLFEIALRILIEFALHIQVVLHEETSIKNLPRLDLDRDSLSPAGAVRAIAAELGFVLRRRFIKRGFVIGRGEVIFRAVVVRLKLRSSLNRLVAREECNRIVTLDGHSVPVQILQVLG